MAGFVHRFRPPVTPVSAQSLGARRLQPGIWSTFLLIFTHLSPAILNALVLCKRGLMVIIMLGRDLVLSLTWFIRLKSSQRKCIERAFFLFFFMLFNIGAYLNDTFLLPLERYALANVGTVCSTTCKKSENSYEFSH